jgi:hypothetical protein
MRISMCEVSIPVFTKFLRNLTTLLDIAQAHADAKEFASVVLMRARPQRGRRRRALD